jgi:hypothetical protein
MGVLEKSQADARDRRSNSEHLYRHKFRSVVSPVQDFRFCKYLKKEERHFLDKGSNLSFGLHFASYQASTCKSSRRNFLYQIWIATTGWKEVPSNYRLLLRVYHLMLFDDCQKESLKDRYSTIHKCCYFKEPRFVWRDVLKIFVSRSDE